MIRCTVLLLLFFGIFSSCKEDGKKISQAPAKAVKQMEKTNPAEALSMEEIKWMFDNIDQIDYEFHSLPISMALSESSGIKNNIGYISPNVQWDIPESCKPIGKQLFYHKGELTYEADLYFDANCRFLVFNKDGKPAYRNKLTKHGQNFYENVFSQVSSIKK